MIRTLQLGHEFDATRWSQPTFGSCIDRPSVMLNAKTRKPYLAGGRAKRVGVVKI